MHGFALYHRKNKAEIWNVYGLAPDIRFKTRPNTTKTNDDVLFIAAVILVI